jgi:hypothetical protein
MVVQLTVNASDEYTDFSAPITLAEDDDLLIEWNPISRFGGIGREPIGQEPAGIGASIADDCAYTVIEIRDIAGALIVESDPILGTPRWSYFREDNKQDHGGAYETDNQFRIVQVSRSARRREIGRIVTT